MTTGRRKRRDLAAGGGSVTRRSIAREAPPAWKYVAAFASVYIIWGSTYLAIRFAVESVPPLIMIGGRFLTAGLILYPVLRMRGMARPSGKTWAAAAVFGFFMLGVGTGTVAWAEQYIDSGLAALIVAAVPMWMVLIDWVRPGGEAPGRKVVLGLAVGFVGVVLIIGPVDLADAGTAGDLGRGTPTAQLLSVLAIILASLSWAAGSVFSRHAPLADSPLMAAAQEMVAAGAIVLLIGLAIGEGSGWSLSMVTRESWIGWGWLVLAGSLVAYVSYVWLLHHTTPARAGSYAYVNPVVAVILGWWLANETFSPRILFAAALVILSVVLITLGRSDKEPTEEGIEEELPPCPG